MNNWTNELVKRIRRGEKAQGMPNWCFSPSSSASSSSPSHTSPPAASCSCDLQNVDSSASLQSLGLLNITEPSWAEQMLNVKRRFVSETKAGNTLTALIFQREWELARSHLSLSCREWGPPHSIPWFLLGLCLGKWLPSCAPQHHLPICFPHDPIERRSCGEKGN